MVALPALETALLEAVVGRALGSGGDFAEVFVEDRDSLGMRLEDGKVEQTAAGARWAPPCVSTAASAPTTPTRDEVDEAGLFAAADAVAAALRAGAAGATSRARRRALASPAVTPSRCRPRRCAIVRKSGPAACRRRGGARLQLRSSARSSPATREGASGCSSPTRSATWCATTARACASSPQVIARRDGIIQTGYETIGGSAGFEIARREGGHRGVRAKRGRQGGDHARRAAGARGRHAGRAGQRVRRHALPRGLRPRARGRRHRQGRQHLRRQAGRGGGGAHRQRLRRRLAAPTAGARRPSTTRACRRSKTHGHRGGPAHAATSTTACAPARAGVRAHRQRPAAVVPPRAHPAHDHDLHRAGRRHSPKTIIAATATRLLRQEPGRRPGRAGQRQLRLRRGRGLPHRERHASRRRCAAPRWSATASTSSSRST